MMPQGLTRRQAVQLWAGAVAFAAASSSSKAAALPEKLGEAPSLAKLVQDGKLPPLAQRLPKNPVVVTPQASVGQYGGTMHAGIRERADSWMIRIVNADGIVNWAQDWNGVIPNVLESWEVSADTKTYTLHLREGMRWSDGEPFTADDLMFVYEDVFSHPQLSGFPEYLVTGEGPAEIRKIDTHTVAVVFKSPNGMFLPLSCPVDEINGGHALLKYPAHFMKKYHAKYNPNADAEARAAGFNNWVQLFEAKASYWESANKPVLNAWIITRPYGSGTQVIAERNPYYWKIDTAGNQLPYIDRIIFEVFQDTEVMLLKGIAGELDLQGRHINNTANQAVLYDGQDSGGYRFITMTASDSSTAAFALNQTVRDPVKREIFRNKNFRIGLSHAIDRKAIIDLVFIGQGIMQQMAVRADYPPLYNKQLATQYLEYDPDLANRKLDEAGYAERDSSGMRLGPDKKPIGIAILARTDKQWMVDVAEMIVRYWREVGIDARLDVFDRSIVRTRRRTGDYDISPEDYSGGSRDALFRSDMYVPVNDEALFGVAWANWYLGLDYAEEPPSEIKAQLKLYDAFKAESDPDKQVAIFREVLQIAADYFHTISVCARDAGFSIVRNRMRNVPETMIGSYIFTPPGPYIPAQFWIDPKA